MKLTKDFRMVAVTVTPFDSNENAIIDEIKKQTDD